MVVVFLPIRWVVVYVSANSIQLFFVSDDMVMEPGLPKNIVVTMHMTPICHRGFV